MAVHPLLYRYTQPCTPSCAPISLHVAVHPLLCLYTPTYGRVPPFCSPMPLHMAVHPLMCPIYLCIAVYAHIPTRGNVPYTLYPCM